MTAPFVHLRVHSEYSLTDGIVRIPDLVKATAEAGMPAVALTDLGNVFAGVKFYQAAVAAGVKPIIGADLWVANSGDAHKPLRLTLLCQNREGYQNLSRLLTRAYLEGQHTGRPCIAREWLEGLSGGLIALSGGHEGDIGAALLAANGVAARVLAADYVAWFPGRFYLELQRTGQPRQEEYNHLAVAFAGETGLPVVATNPVVFLQRDEFQAHEIRVCIQEGRILADSRRPRRYTTQQYFRSAAEMAELFADVPEACANTLEIARRCNFRLEFGRYYLPAFPVPEGMTIDELLIREARVGLDRRLSKLPDAERTVKEPAYRDRLEMEIEVIAKMGFSGYFLIVADFIRWAKENDVPVGPGRGSGAGSLVAYSLGITELDPIKYELLFERFLNPERISMPDFDVDFCMERRDRVIEYVQSRYGADHVSQIITHGTMAARAVVRDVGRVLDHSYGYCDKIAKLIPAAPGQEITLEDALRQEPLLKERYDREEDVRALIDSARALEGLARSAGKHAAGVVIAPGPLTDFMPLYCEAGNPLTVTQFDMIDIEALGLVKFDFLGLRNLTIIDHALKIINAERATRGEPPIVIEDLPLDDATTYSLIKSARTTALFQLESRGMKELITRLKPDKFEEIVALVALFRPGPLQSGMVDDYINRKHGRTAVKYPHPSLEAILKPTYGVILYQEQVMQIAQVLSGYTLGGADLLRRAMGKKKPEEMAKQRDVFVKGAEGRGVNAKLAADIFDLIEKFAGYGFNRSHSAAYALIAYQTAWLKAHYPAAFMAAVLSSDMDKTDKVVTMIAECRDMRLNVIPPDINRCQYAFVPVDDKTVLYGLGAIKGLGQSAIEGILQTREEGGPFRDLFDLCRRIDARRVNRRVLESLIKAGALDALGTHRAALMASLTKAVADADQHSRNVATGQSDLFGAGPAPSEALAYEAVPEWSEDQRLEGEKETLGLYLTGHPINRYADELKRITSATIAELKPTQDRAVVVAGLVVGMRIMQTRRGDRMAFITLDDRTGRLELAVFSELFERNRDLLVKDTLLIVEGHVAVDEYTGGFKMSAEKLYNIEQARAAFGSRVVIELDAGIAGNGFVDELREILAPASQGPCPVHLRYRSDAAEAEIVLGEEWRIRPSSAVLERLARLAGERNVRLVYR
ncbi:DNA polymerase III subunit alpha [Sulfurifustis variabilis]|uniref:DNA polymerase III subunit alpha n=1 Tax=Sulfurifustis variabilis TaxID=1675686 RepID=A0A1B4V3U2_9GAMM|nr:DNA polymerase III subunit alpha [Sulfurifustis variabilis]BAU48203.1 DNA polymerase III subunit alpha [Sulfurifustis variabilis]